MDEVNSASPSAAPVNDIGDIGLWAKLRAPEAIEIAADAGFSFIIVDLEHSPLSLESAADHVAIATARGMAALVRVATPEAREIGPMLDAGATGIVVAHVDTGQDAAMAVSATRFPPEGRRGSGSTGRAGRWGTGTRQSYLAPETGPPLCIVQIESSDAITNLDSILDAGIDAILIGPADLALSMGAPDSETVGKAISTALATAKEAGMPCGTAVSGGEAAAIALNQGFDFVVGGADTTLLARAGMELVAASRRPAS